MFPEIAEEYGLSATYSPEDNKLRLYAEQYFDDALKEEIKGAGFKWARHQECWVAPMWTPKREDLLLELCGEIGDEQYGAAERSADRAERFGGYRDKRRGEAQGSADTFDQGPGVYGHQNRQRAERQAARHDRHRTYAVSQWSKAEYWQQRTAGVIGTALYKLKPAVRRSRILRLEAEQRRHQKTIEASAAAYQAWQKVAGMTGAEHPLPLDENGYAVTKQMNPAQRLAYDLANHGHAAFWHPTSEKANEEAKRLWGHGFSGYDFLTKTEFLGQPFRRLSPLQFAELYLEKVTPPDSPDSWSQRWAAHYALRLEYERAMLENEGGTVAAVEIIPGGFIGEHQIYKVNKSRATGRVVSVLIKGQWGYVRINGKQAYVDHANGEGLAKLNIERLGEDAYRPPTPEELEAFNAEVKAGKAKAKTERKGAPKLLNPTDEDAERLQALWNKRGAELHAKHSAWGEYNPTEVQRMTQAQYSAASKGSYSHFETIPVCENGRRPRRDYGRPADGSPIAFKIRKRYGSGTFTGQADAVIVLTDKPRKSLPLDWAAIEAPQTADTLSAQPTVNAALYGETEPVDLA